MKNEFDIYDEDGFIALVNVDKYSSFVDENWELDQLMNHFIHEMNNDSLIIWGTEPGGGKWKIRITDSPSKQTPYRVFEKQIEVTAGKLYLTNYTDLTMAAQFKDEKIPAEHNSNMFIQLNNGKYHITVRQLVDYNKLSYDSKEICFEIIIAQPSKSLNSIEDIFWWNNN